MSDWYLDWFNDDYLELYSHRNAEEAETQIGFILDQLVSLDSADPSSGNPQLSSPNFLALDAACGAGRHLRALQKFGRAGIGIDTSTALLRSAPAGLRLVQGNIKLLPFSSGTFSLLLSMFTSFGYFATDDENLQALQEFHRVLLTEGVLVIDFLNAPQIIDSLNPYSEEERDNRRIIQQRTLSADRRRIEKRISIVEIGSDTRKEFTESVRLFSRIELHNLLETANFSVAGEWGNWDGGEWSKSSSRLIILARKSSRLSAGSRI